MLTVSPLLFLIVLFDGHRHGLYHQGCLWQVRSLLRGQQKNLGIENGFIEEMMSGQKVVKAFVHERESIEDFDRINDQLFESSYQANRYANVLMPILGNLGNVSFVLTALIGGLFALNGVGGLNHWWSHGLSAIEPFLHRSDCPGLSTIELCPHGLGLVEIVSVDLLDEEEEVDQGKVTLVNYELVDGEMVETDQKTNKWLGNTLVQMGIISLSRWSEMWSLMMLISLMMIRNKSFMASTCTRIRGKKWPLSERLVQERHHHQLDQPLL